MNNIIPLDSILVPLSAVLGLSLIVERALEIISNFWERLIGTSQGKLIPKFEKKNETIDNLEKVFTKAKQDSENEKNAEKNQVKIKQLLKKLSAEKDAVKRQDLRAEIKKLQADGEWDESVSQSITLVESASDPDDGITLKQFVLQVLGFALGIILVHYTGIRFFSTFISALHSDVVIPIWADFMLTGLLIGGGSAPMHALIRFITTRKITGEPVPPSQEAKESEAVSEVKAPAVITTPPDTAMETWIDIPYQGGVDREILEHVHKRDANPKLVVFHHTTMNSSSTFDDVVRTIKSRTDSRGNHWITGYNCVVLYDGSIHPFCRWDRYGNHAAGNNRRSLGLAFNGNFETNPNVPFSNPTGRMGAQQPSEAQLKAGAKVVTLWTFLYKDIKPDFKKFILPHKELADKACPGGNFPYDEFESLVLHYTNLWTKSSFIQERIAEFKLKPYLYV
jgi:hypothetical protein